LIIVEFPFLVSINRYDTVKVLEPATV